MELIFYPIHPDDCPDIVPALKERDWMDATDRKFAYRCLPLNIANAHGWCILNSTPFQAEWSGGDSKESINIVSLESPMATSHFGHGILTFHINGLFRTSPGYDLWVTGPVNEFKDGIQALTGVVEIDKATATFTMNWQFTRKHNIVTFGRHDPICMFFPIQRGVIEAVQPEICPLESEPELHAKYLEWTESRSSFLKELHVTNSDAQKQGWQKDYFKESVRTKVVLNPFKRK